MPENNSISDKVSAQSTTTPLTLTINIDSHSLTQGTIKQIKLSAVNSSSILLYLILKVRVLSIIKNSDLKKKILLVNICGFLMPENMRTRCCGRKSHYTSLHYLISATLIKYSKRNIPRGYHTRTSDNGSNKRV